MLKSISKLNGAQQLSKKEQKQVNGGGKYLPLCNGLNGCYWNTYPCIAPEGARICERQPDSE